MKTVKLIALTFTLATALSANAALIAKWSFDETTGATVSDAVGSFPGTLSPSGAAFVPGGIAGGAISLNQAANGFVNMGNVLALSTGDYSIVCWIKMTAGDRTPGTIILGKHAAYSKNGYFLHVNSQGGGLLNNATNKVLFYQGGSGLAPITPAETPISTNNVNDGNWHQIVAVYRAGGLKSIYVDGAPAESSKPSQTPLGNTASFMIGGVHYSGVPTGQFTGLIDEVQIYSHALSNSDIDYLFQNPAQAVMDCEQSNVALRAELAAANATIASQQIELNALNLRVGELEGELLSIDSSILRLESKFQVLFKNPGFQIPGDTTSSAVNNIVVGIENLNRGAQQLFYNNVR